MRYSVVIERTDNGYSAYVPDQPGCIAAADTRSEVDELIREAVVGHVEMLHEHGEAVPEPHTSLVHSMPNNSIRAYQFLYLYRTMLTRY